MAIENLISYFNPVLSFNPDNIVEVKVLVISNKLKVGPLKALPQTIETAVASPNALPIPNTIPDIIQDFAEVNTTLKFV